MSKVRIVAALAVVSVLALTIIACGGDSNTRDESLTVGGLAETVLMEGLKFQPGNLQVPAGAVVTWENGDSVPHDAKAEDDSWETEQLGEGETDSLTFAETGAWDYICTIHPGMKARITVIDPGAEGTPRARAE